MVICSLVLSAKTIDNFVWLEFPKVACKLCWMESIFFFREKKLQLFMFLFPLLKLLIILLFKWKRSRILVASPLHTLVYFLLINEFPLIHSYKKTWKKFLAPRFKRSMITISTTKLTPLLIKFFYFVL